MKLIMTHSHWKMNYKKVNDLHIKVFKYNGPFLDIGTPDDLNKIEETINKYG